MLRKKNLSTLLWALTALMCLAFGLIEVCAPMPLLVDKFLPDDAFYYFTTAYHFAHSGIPSFDGHAVTSGFHPLWFLMCSLVYLFRPLGSAAAIRALLFLQALLSAGAFFIVASSLSKKCKALSIAIPSAIFIAISAYEFVNGLETPVLLFLTAAVIAVVVRSGTIEAALSNRKQRLLFGILLGLLFLARTDQVFTLAWYSLTVLLLLLPKRKLFAVIEVGAPIAVLVLGYLSYNYFTTGHVVQVSGSAKVFYSAQRRAASIAAHNGDWVAAYISNLRWMTRQTNGYALLVLYSTAILASLGSVIVWVRRGYQALSEEARIIMALLPLVLGNICSTIFYHTSFFGWFSSTPWYYPSQYLLLIPIFGLTINGIVRAAAAWSGKDRFVEATLFALIAFGTLSILALGSPLYPYRFIIPLLILFSAALNLAQIGALGVTLYAILLPLNFYRVLIKQGPSTWNYALYEGAQWAKKYAPPGATLWSGSSGILGYFSERRVINTDGLINSYDFLENVLKAGKVGAYVRAYDYAIDAWGVPSGLIEAHPLGCEVALPKDIPQVTFQDGALTRRLTIFKMDCSKR